MLIEFKRKLGPTVEGKKPLLSLSNQQKEELLKLIRKDWRELIRLHFKAEGGISDGKVYSWKPLSEKYLEFKRQKGLQGGILEATTPNLSSRYQKSIRYNPKSFRIWMTFPPLKTGGGTADAGVHQLPGTRIKRRIIKKDFVAAARKRVLGYFTK